LDPFHLLLTAEAVMFRPSAGGSWYRCHLVWGAGQGSEAKIVNPFFKKKNKVLNE